MNRQKVLVVDDDAAVRLLFTTVLREAYEVRQASDGIDAMNRLLEDPVDLLVTDIEMPRIDGCDLVRWVKERWPPIPCLVVSSVSDRFYTSELPGFDHCRFLLKPVRISQILNSAREMLEQRWATCQSSDPSREQ